MVTTRLSLAMKIMPWQPLPHLLELDVEVKFVVHNNDLKLQKKKLRTFKTILIKSFYKCFEKASVMWPSEVYVPADKIVANLGHDSCRAMPFSNLFSECDTTSCFKSIVQTTAWDTWRVHSDVTWTIMKLTHTNWDYWRWLFHYWETFCSHVQLYSIFAATECGKIAVISTGRKVDWSDSPHTDNSNIVYIMSCILWKLYLGTLCHYSKKISPHLNGDG